MIFFTDRAIRDHRTTIGHLPQMAGTFSNKAEKVIWSAP